MVLCWGGIPKKDFLRKHDIILRYTATDRYYFNPPMRKYSPTGSGIHSDGSKYDLEKDQTPHNDWWSDIAGLNTMSKERLGYPTQKPIALLERIISASSNEGDMILDPFCGCATACSAAEKIDRQWVGIDISSKAVDLLKDRLVREAGIDMFTKGAGMLIHRTDIPIRKGRVSKDIKHKLYGLQEGKCNGCGQYFEFRHFHKDHREPRAKGGPDDDSNLQLLCGHCNTTKGTGTMAELKARLIEMGVLN